MYNSLQFPMRPLHMLSEFLLIVLHKYFLVSITCVIVVLDGFQAFCTEEDAFTGAVYYILFRMLFAPVLGLLDMDIAESVAVEHFILFVNYSLFTQTQL